MTISHIPDDISYEIGTVSFSAYGARLCFHLTDYEHNACWSRTEVQEVVAYLQQWLRQQEQAADGHS